MRKVRTERFLTKRHIALVAVLLAFPLVAGCPQEVPYASPDKGAPESGTPAADQPATDEAPAFSPEESTTSEYGAAADPAATEPIPTETAASEPAEAPPERLPWEASDKPAETPKEAAELFAAVDKPAEATAKPPAAAEENKKEEEGDGFGDFLDQAYASTAKEEPAATETEAEQQPAEEPKPTDELATATPSATEPEAKADDNWWQDSTKTPSAAAPPIESPAAETPQVETPAAETTPEPKAPSATASSNADLLDELWGEETDTSAEAKEPEPAPAVETPTKKDDTTEAPTLPFDEPSQPAEGKSLFDEPEVEAQVETKQPEPLPAPETAKPPAAERAAPMAADVMKPLPAVPVLEFNTRHLAWLLGGKLGLAELADLDGATPTEVAEWRSEVARLAKSLKVADPSTGGAASAADERVKNMLDAASRAGAELTQAHGPDHAALLEIALKTNALLVVAKDHPDLAGSVGRAVEGAAERAMLPKFLWEDSVRALKANPDADQTHDAVVRLHQRVESFLR